MFRSIFTTAPGEITLLRLIVLFLMCGGANLQLSVRLRDYGCILLAALFHYDNGEGKEMRDQHHPPKSRD